MTAQIDIRSLLRIDAAFEGALGLVLTVGGGFGWLTGSDFPVSRGVVIAVGVAFLLASASVVFFVRAPRRVMFELALGNGAMALAGLVWLLGDRRFSSGGTVILGIVVVWKFAISALELNSLRRVSSKATGSSPATG